MNKTKTSINEHCHQDQKKLFKAQQNKDDEFYTLYSSVEFYVLNYLQDKLANKIIYCNCDSEESNFVKYFQDHKDELNYKELWYTSDDYRNHFDLLEKCDIVITNPPFSIFTKYYFPDLLKSGKEFFIIANRTFLMRTYWLPLVFNGTIKIIDLPHYKYKNQTIFSYRRPNGEILEVCTIVLTNLPNIKNQRLHSNPRYKRDLKYNFNDIPHDYIQDEKGREILNINQINYMPKDYTGLMAVPVTNIILYLDILDIVEIPKKSLKCNGKNLFTRVIVKFKNDLDK